MKQMKHNKTHLERQPVWAQRCPLRCHCPAPYSRNLGRLQGQQDPFPLQNSAIGQQKLTKPLRFPHHGRARASIQDRKFIRRNAWFVWMMASSPGNGFLNEFFEDNNRIIKTQTHGRDNDHDALTWLLQLGSYCKRSPASQCFRPITSHCNASMENIWLNLLTGCGGGRRDRCPRSGSKLLSFGRNDPSVSLSCWLDSHPPPPLHRRWKVQFGQDFCRRRTEPHFPWC